MVSPDFLLVDQPHPGLERLQARFAGYAYDLHRHETYAVGLTEHGTQSFRYRGVERTSTAGKTIVIHPDELHDGHAGRALGFAYRMLYVDPQLISAALDNRPISPFVPDVVADDCAVAAVLAEAFEGFPGPIDPLAVASIVAELADALCRRADNRIGRSRPPPHVNAVSLARDFLDAARGTPVSSEQLERASGVDRYTLARSFRAQIGTSPHRYLIGRRLLRVRAGIAHGVALAEAAIATGFADQSQMTRHDATLQSAFRRDSRTLREVASERPRLRWPKRWVFSTRP